MAKKLHGLSMAILAVNSFEQIEMTQPRTALIEAGAHTCLISLGATVKRWHHDQPAAISAFNEAMIELFATKGNQ